MAKRNQYNRPNLAGLGGPISLAATQKVTFGDLTLRGGWDVVDDLDTDGTAITNGTLVSLSQTANFEATMFTNVTLTAGQHFRVSITNGHILPDSFIFTTVAAGGARGLRTMLESQTGGNMVIKVFSTSSAPAGATVILYYGIFGAA